MDGTGHPNGDRLSSEPVAGNEMDENLTPGNHSPSDDATRHGSGLPSGAPVSPVVTTDPFAAGVEAVTSSEIGVQTLLNRLKQSIASAKEFALFLKKRSTLEEEHANGLRKICRLASENMKKAEHRQGSFAVAYDEVTRIHESMAENGLNFAGSLHQMHEDLLEMAANMERGRKHWKQTGLNAEQRLLDTEAAMRKSQSKYHSIADDYDRARTGDRQGGKIFGIKGPKSAAQHEEDLLRKVQGADADYAQKVQSAQTSRSELWTRGRPEAIKNLTDLIRECDSALTLQMAKFASFNEKLLLHNGLSVSPLKGADGEPSSRSLRDAVASIDNERDMNYYVASYSSKVPPKPTEIKYERHSVLAPAQQAPPPQVQRQSEPIQSFNSRQGPPPQQSSFSTQQHQPSAIQNTSIPNPMTVNPPGGSPMGQQSTSNGQPGPSHSPIPMAQRPMDNRSFGSAPTSGPQPHDRSFSAGHHQPSPTQYGYNVNNSLGSRGQSQQSPSYSTGSVGSKGPPQLSSLPFQQQSPSFQQGSASSFSSPQNASHHPLQSAANSNTGNLPPLKPVFGMTLDQLFDRDGSAVPMVVYQCIQAVDLFGLEVEGIYRMSGTASHVNKIKAMFDNDASKVDFRNPENFFHDVNSVAGLLKQFFRDLPNPLLTAEHYSAFIDAAKSDDEIVRRDSLHAIINSLPDPNYATLRALTLHLNRVQENSASNRMNASNLAIVFGPTLMGANTGPNIQDAGWQVRVIDTILNNTYQIFDDD